MKQKTDLPQTDIEKSNKLEESVKSSMSNLPTTIAELNEFVGNIPDLVATSIKKFEEIGSFIEKIITDESIRSITKNIVLMLLSLVSLGGYRTFNSPEKLVIKNFGAIREVELELKQTTVFIGPQSSGKSTIAKLIDIFRNPNFLVMFDDLSQQETSTKNYLSFFEHHNLQNFFEEQTQLEYICDKYRFSYVEGEFKLVFFARRTRKSKFEIAASYCPTC